MDDLRPEDIKKMKKEGVESDWVSFWENYMCNEYDKVKDENQRFWHTSRLSFLAGYKLAMEKNVDMANNRIDDATLGSSVPTQEDQIGNNKYDLNGGEL